MRTWLTHHRARVAGKSPLGEALAYIAKYWDGLCVYLSDGRVEIDNNTVERSIRPIAGPESLCTPSQVSVNIGSVSVSAMRHGRLFRAIAAWTVAEARSLTLI
jgi:hypothetical protein